MLPHDELLHYGVKGMRWGIRRTTAGDKAANYQKKARETSKEIGNIASRMKTDAAGNSYMTVGDMSRANRLINKQNKYVEKAKKYQRKDAEIAKKIAAKQSLKKKIDPAKQKKYEKTFKNAAISVGIGVTGMAIGRLLGPTIGSYGKAIEGKIGYDAVRKAASATDDIFKYAASL